MVLLAWVITGLIAGWLAGVVIKGSGFGALGDLILGVIGALAGGFLAGAFFRVVNPLNNFDLTTLATAFLGAVISVALVRALPGPTQA